MIDQPRYVRERTWGRGMNKGCGRNEKETEKRGQVRWPKEAPGTGEKPSNLEA